MLFDNDIVLVAETKKEVSNKLDKWRETLEGKVLCISRTKTEYLRCDFSGTSPVGEPEVSIGELIVKSMTKYKYLGSIIQRDEEIDGDVNHRIHMVWLK
jgi:hypothetical protein